jgi:predicted enzyme related to lactoylglutathione lyase
VDSSILNVTFDCVDAGSLARFWSEVSGLPCSKQEMPGNPYWVVGDPDGRDPRLVFVNVPEKKATKNRLHLDLVPRGGSQRDELVRIESLGARIVDDRRSLEPGGWVVMEDPEGNEFCLEGGDS